MKRGSFLRQTQEGFLKFPVFNYHKFFASRRASDMGELSGSFMQGTRNQVGLLGEEVFKSVYPYAVHVDAYGHDFLLGELKVEVKSQTCNVKPQLSFENVLYRNSKQDFDVLVIASICKRDCYFVGYLESLEGLEEVVAGQQMPNGGTYKAGGLRIRYSELNRDWGKLWAIAEKHASTVKETSQDTSQEYAETADLFAALNVKRK